MHIIDTHCHLQYLDYDKIHTGGYQEVLDKCLVRDVKSIINISCTLEEYESAKQEFAEFDNIYFAVGVHPSHAHEVSLNLDKLRTYMTESRVVAVGEIGLDSYWTKDFLDIQRQYFKDQLAIAKEFDKPIIVHTRGDIALETLQIIRESGVTKGVVHCFTENQEIANQVLEIGLHIGVGGISTFKNAQDLRDVLITVPIERILTETDSPYLAPVPHRGKENQPAFVADVVNYMCAVKGMTPKEFAIQTTKNAIRLFKLPIDLSDVE